MADAHATTDGMPAAKHLEAVIDNDVMIKAACYGIPGAIARGRSVGVLGSARYVARTHIGRMKLSGSVSEAQSHFDAALEQCSEIEPTPDELALAATFETAALKSGLSLDSGESLLVAVLLSRSISVLETGDKRAIAALEQLLDTVPTLASIAGRVRSLEQLVNCCVSQGHGGALARAICAEPAVDKTLSICFRCASPPPRGCAVDQAGLESYIKRLRTEAPRVLES